MGMGGNEAEGSHVTVASPSPALEPQPEDITVRIQQDLQELEKEDLEQILTSEEKRFLLYVERGDVASVKHILKKGQKENKKKQGSFNMNCLDPLGRSALNVAIENENMEMIQLLLSEKIEPMDALLHAIEEEYVEGVEVLIAHEEKIHTTGQFYSWQKMKGQRASFTSDITPLILAAHKNNYEILKLLFDRGATLPMPHDIKCACDECLTSSGNDSLRHSLSRINAYRALASPSVICLSSTDPLVTAFSLSEDLKKLATLEYEYRQEYTALRKQVQTFSMALVDETRSSSELQIILNYDPEDGEPFKKGNFMHLARLKEAVDTNQKEFVAHANVQQLLGTVWYDGMPGFKRRGVVEQLLEIGKIGAMFPVYCSAFLTAPKSAFGASLKKPFIKFIVHSSSYCFFLLLLVIVSLQIETLVIEWFGTEWMVKRLRKQQQEARGGFPSVVEFLIVIYIFGFMWSEIKTLWEEGLLNYIKDLWNFIDYCTTFFYMNWIFLRLTAWFLCQRAIWSDHDPYYPREMWPPFDPLLLSEGMFGAANILSFLKLVHIFSVNPHMGPLQIALGRMVVDIIKFFFIYTLVLFAFGCGLNQMLWYYAEIDKARCYSLPGGLPNPKQSRSCSIWRRFTNLFETSQSLFWASFGLVDLTNFELTGIKSFTRFWGMLMYGSYNVINVIVLLNLLIAMMSNSYTIIIDKCDVEWKFARSKLWMSYFEEGDELPAPFNLIPNFHSLFGSGKVSHRESIKRRRDDTRDNQYQGVMRNLVRRYVTAEQRKSDEAAITEDDINEVKQDISSFKYELINILKINGMDTGRKHEKEDTALGKKQQARERRLLKGFNIGLVEGIVETAVKEMKKPRFNIANIVCKVTKKEKKDWNVTMRKSIRQRDPIGSSSTSLQREKLRECVRQDMGAWKKVQFYQSRGVFTGGAINPTMLRMINKAQEPRVTVESRCKGWRKLKVLQEQGEVTQENYNIHISRSPSPAPPSPSLCVHKSDLPVVTPSTGSPESKSGNRSKSASPPGAQPALLKSEESLMPPTTEKLRTPPPASPTPSMKDLETLQAVSADPTKQHIPSTPKLAVPDSLTPTPAATSIPSPPPPKPATPVLPTPKPTTPISTAPKQATTVSSAAKPSSPPPQPPKDKKLEAVGISAVSGQKRTGWL